MEERKSNQWSDGERGGAGREREEGGKKKDLKESGRKAEGSDTDREKMFNLARCSTETLNLLQSLWKVKAGWQRGWLGQVEKTTNLLQMATESLVCVCC